MKITLKKLKFSFVILLSILAVNTIFFLAPPRENQKDLGAMPQETLSPEQQGECLNEAMLGLIQKAEDKTQKGAYQEALDDYRKVYKACPIKDMEEVMAWLLSQVEAKDNSMEETK